MKMTTLYTTAFLVCLSGAALAIPQAPHDAAHNVSCADCHTPYASLQDQAAFSGAIDASSTATNLVVPTATWTASQWVSGVITFTSGANLGQFRTITANTATSIAWDLPLAVAPAPGDTFMVGKTSLTDIETKCTSCHNPTGPAATMANVGIHQTDVGSVSCSKCHEPHNIAPNSGVGNAIVRATLRIGNGIAVVFPSGETNKYVVTSGGNNGICQACHTKTKYWSNDGLNMTHNADKACTDCHKHEEGFGGAMLTSAHGTAGGVAFAGGSQLGQSCARCHTSDGYQDYIGVDGSDNHLSGTFMGTAAGTVQPYQCATCHNPAADALTSVMFPSGLTVTGLNKQTAICSQCHQGRESTVSVNSKTAAIAALGVSSTATSGSTTTLLDTAKTWTASQWNNSYILFTSGPNLGVYRKISATTAPSTITWLTPLPTAIGVGVKYQLLTSTSGNNVGVDAQMPSQSFVNVHYLAASATLHGDAAKMAFQYPAANSVPGTSGDQPNTTFAAKVPNPVGASAYAGKNPHGVTQDDCTSCHNKHTLEISTGTCGNCHTIKDETTGVTRKVATVDDLENMRQFGFNGDIDGDGVEEGIKFEIDGLEAKLLAVIQAYANRNAVLNPTIAKPICYNGATYPYYFVDTNADGACSATEAVSANAYGYVSGATGHTGYFTTRLLRATYNYQYVQKDPGAWAHNPKYVIGILYDSITDLNAGVTALSGTPVTFAGRRGFYGHFDGSANAFHFRDAQGGFEYPCLRCHSGKVGFEAFLASTTPTDWTSFGTVGGPQGQECTTCHTPQAGDTDMKRLRDMTATPAGGVRFPGHWWGGKVGTYNFTLLGASAFADPKDMICSTCHGGRDINGAGLEQYLDGTASAIDVPGRPFYGAAASVADNGSGKVRLSGLPVYLPVPATAPVGTTSSYNWLYTTSCQAINKWVTISGAANPAYNGTWKITACTATGTADLALNYDAVNAETNNGALSWASWAAGTKNVHDIQGAARMMGSTAHEGYEYAGKTYAGALQHHGKTGSCIECHSPIATRHTFDTVDAVNAGTCLPCHTGAAYGTWSNAARNLASGPGYDGDPSTTTLAAELGGLSLKFAAAVNLYVRTNNVVSVGTTVGNPCWNATSAKWFLSPGNTTGICVGTETASWSGYDPKLSRAMYNFSFWQQDPGAWAHNFDYIAQLFYDSIVDLGGDTTGLVRP